MKLTSGRAAIVALLFIGAQAAPGLHAALEPAHEIHVCCTDGKTETHIDACGVDHHPPPCPVCAASRAPASAAPEAGSITVERAPVPTVATPDEIHVDPLNVEFPDSRGPPA
jgi:hypothetical protein